MQGQNTPSSSSPWLLLPRREKSTVTPFMLTVKILEWKMAKFSAFIASTMAAVHSSEKEVVPAFTLTAQYLEEKNATFAEAMEAIYWYPPDNGSASPEAWDYTGKTGPQIASFIKSKELPRDYAGETISQLKTKLRSRNLAVGGRKATLLARVHQHDANQPPSIIITYHHVGFPFLRLTSELRSMIYDRLSSGGHSISAEVLGELGKQGWNAVERIRGMTDSQLERLLLSDRAIMDFLRRTIIRPRLEAPRC
ncbi:hypothetical protein MMC28_005536 [Mycoblastus sanguinarius]|nr:hypothetical protein [Mycoblastus sanguinarius]